MDLDDCSTFDAHLITCKHAVSLHLAEWLTLREAEFKSCECERCDDCIDYKRFTEKRLKALHELNWIENDFHFDLYEPVKDMDLNEVVEIKYLNVKYYYDKFNSWGIKNHFDIVDSHWKWIKGVYNLLNRIGVLDIITEPDFEKRIVFHDISKYSFEEAPGYALMFGCGKGMRDEVKTDPIWENALMAHYKRNQHHPEHYYPKLTGLLKWDKENEASKMPFYDLYESVIDVLACRSERDLKDQKVVTALEWFDLPKFVLDKYSKKDLEEIDMIFRIFLDAADKYYFSDLKVTERLSVKFLR